jgi:hypothetical protein
MIYSLVAVAACVIVVVARYLVSVRIQQMNQHALDAEKGLRKLRLDLKAAENKQAIAELELKKQEREKRKLEILVRKYDEELEK